MEFPSVIKDPCHEDWDKMKIGLISRHCSVCNKGVMDFTQMERTEILAYLLKHRTEGTCGRIKTTQLDFTYKEYLVTINGLKERSKGNLAFYLLSLGAMLVLSCKNTPDPSTIEIVKALPDTEVVFEDWISTVPVIAKTDLVLALEALEKERLKALNKLNYPQLAVSETYPIQTPLTTMGLIHTPAPASLENSISPGSNFVAPQTMPEFPGGLDSLKQFIKTYLIYPEKERKQNLEGTVYTSFVVKKDGSITDINITQDIQSSANFSKEVLQVLKRMPKWIPGKDKAGAVDVLFHLPVQFKLQRSVM